MKPKIIFSDKILDRLSIFMKVGGFTFWPYIILREKFRDNRLFMRDTPRIINHETIHIKQQQEMGVIFFYVWYIIEWFIKLFLFGTDAYYHISFEREAHTNDDNLDYLKTRKLYSWFKYL